MSTSLPDSVVNNTKDRVVVNPWEITFRQGTTNATVKGELLWVPGPSALPYLLGAALIAGAIVALSLWAGLVASRRTTVLKIVGLLAIVLVIVDIIHLAGIAFGIEGTVGEGLGRMATIGFVSMAAWVLAFIGVALVKAKRADAPYLITFSAGLMAIVGGFADLGVLSKSNLPFAFAVGSARFLVMATIGLGIGLALAGILLTRPIPGDVNHLSDHDDDVRSDVDRHDLEGSSQPSVVAS
jgi:hypothetical protein